MAEQNRENLGPAERIIQTLLGQIDHMVHNRPGMTTPAPADPTGVLWQPVTHKVEDDKKIVYRQDKDGKKTALVRIGHLWADNTIRDENRIKLADYQPAGIFPAVAVWLYRQVASVWQLDNEFCARWASYAFKQDNKDLKVLLAAFLLVQSRKGDPVKAGGEVLFFDENYRDVGEAMALHFDPADKQQQLSPKHILRIHKLLTLDEIAEINRELGFGKSARNPYLGRWRYAVQQWLEYREQNPRVLDGLVKKGYRTTVMSLCRKVGYKPESASFFKALRWKQAQSKQGHRDIAIGDAVDAAETLAGLPEANICEWIMQKKPSYKRLVGMVPKEVGLTRAIVAAAIEAGSFSDKDLITATPTLESLGLLKNDQDVRERWEAATKRATDQRAAHIAQNVKSKETREKLAEAADIAVKVAVEEVIKGVHVYVFVDISSSMQGAIEAAKGYIEKFLPAFPAEQLHICVFHTAGRLVELKHHSAAGVSQAFRGIRAGGATDYGMGVLALADYPPKEDEDSLFIFVGDEAAKPFAHRVEASGLRPMAFGLVKVVAPGWAPGTCVTDTAQQLGIPCFQIHEHTFDDAYAVPRTIRDLIAATPVGGPKLYAAPARRVTLVDQILKTDLLQKPAWAA